MMMKRILAMMLALFLLAGTAAAGAEEANPYRADSYDFTLRFRLNAEAFPLHDREYMQGYADLLEALEFRGNYSQSMQGKYVDMSFEVVPVTNPDAAVSFRIFGRPKNWLNVSSSLLGDAAVCFQPPQIMPFVVRAWETFQIPLFPIALAIPTLTEAPYTLLYENWSTEVRERKDRSVIDRDTLQRIAKRWRDQIATDRTITDWIAAASRPLGDGEYVARELRSLPDLLLNSADGQDLAVENPEGGRRYIRHDGKVLFERLETENSFESRLDLPPSSTDYTPGFTYRTETTEEGSSLSLHFAWDRTSDDEMLPETILRLNAETEKVPSGLPADAHFTGAVSTEGTLVPNFSFLMDGVTTAEGSVNLTLTLTDRPEMGPVFSCEGTITQVPREGELWYEIGDIVTDFDLFALNDHTLNTLRGIMIPALTEELPDFIYELPASGCRSILDALEKYGLLQIVALN